MKSLKGKKIAIFGANGSVGRRICVEFCNLEARVLVFVKDVPQLQKLRNFLGRICVATTEDEMYPKVPIPQGSCVIGIHEAEGTKLFFDLGTLKRLGFGKLDGAVYAVGHCPKGNADLELGTPISQLNFAILTRDMTNLVIGLQNTFRQTLPMLTPGSQFVVVGSAITRIPPEARPRWMNAVHYSTAQQAQIELCRGLAVDPIVRKCGVHVSRLAFGAIDTPFFKGSTHRPSAMLTLGDVTNFILDTLTRDYPVNAEIVRNGEFQIIESVNP